MNPAEIQKPKFNYSIYYSNEEDEQTDSSQNKLLLKYQKIHDKFIADIRQISDDMIATISYDNLAKIWKITNKNLDQGEQQNIFQCVAEFKINNKKLSVGFDYSQRFNQFAICSLDSSVSLYMMGANSQWRQRNKRIQHSTSVLACNFFDKLKALCTIDMNGQLNVWSVKHIYCLRIVTGQKISSYDFIKFNSKKVAFIKDWRVVSCYDIFSNKVIEKQHNLQIKKMNLSKMNGSKIIITFCKHINIWGLNKNGNVIQNILCISMNMVNTEVIGMNMFNDRYLIYATRVSAWIPHQTLYQSIIKFYDITEEQEGRDYIIHEGVNRTYFLQELNENLDDELNRKLYYFTREDGSIALISSDQLIPSQN